jgi:hypothetical protein
LKLSASEISLLAAKWMEQCVDGTPKWTPEMEAVDDAVRNQPDVAWSIILELVAQSRDDNALSNVAAGPLEDLLALHGEAVIASIESEASRNRDLRRCLQLVWGESRIAQDVFQRFVRASRDD